MTNNTLYNTEEEIMNTGGRIFTGFLAGGAVLGAILAVAKGLTGMIAIAAVAAGGLFGFAAFCAGVLAFGIGFGLYSLYKHCTRPSEESEFKPSVVNDLSINNSPTLRNDHNDTTKSITSTLQSSSSYQQANSPLVSNTVPEQAIVRNPQTAPTKHSSNIFVRFFARLHKSEDVSRDRDQEYGVNRSLLPKN